MEYQQEKIFALMVPQSHLDVISNAMGEMKFKDVIQTWNFIQAQVNKQLLPDPPDKKEDE